MSMVLRTLFPVALAAFACSSAGPYGHSRTYAPLSDEASAARTAVDYDPSEATRFADEWKTKTVSVFGIVMARPQGRGGTTDLKLSLRRLEDRNLCESDATSSCRVTVSEREHGIVHALLRLSSDDAIGEQSVGPGSLVRVIGRITDEVDGTDGTQVIQGSYYRHWPRNFYVTTAARSYMRR